MDAALLKNEVQALINQEPRTWVQISCILDAVASSEYWKQDHSSFTAWVQWVAEKRNIKPATLWRYLSAGRYYNTFKHKSNLTIKTVPLCDLPISVSPENLEILSKLERVVAPDVFAELAEKVLAGSVKRSFLRIQWEAYSRQFDMPSNRGRGVKSNLGSPLVLMNDLKIYLANIMTAFHTYAPTWTGCKDSDAYRIFTDISLPRLEKGLTVNCECVAAIKHQEDLHKKIDLHGVRIYNFINFENPKLDLLINENPQSYFDCYSKYLNFVWWLLPPYYEGTMAFPEEAGILVYNDSKIEVLRSAKRCQPQPEFSDALLRQLMFEK